MQILTYKLGRLEVKALIFDGRVWTDTVEEEGRYLAISRNDSLESCNVFGPVYVNKIKQTGTFVWYSLGYWLPVNNGAKLWSKV